MAKIGDSVKKKVPELRFPGFTDDWEERKLNENVENIGTGRSSFKAGLDYSEQTPYEVLGSTSVISYSDSFDHSGNFVLTARVGANAGNLYKHSGNVKISDNTVYIQSKNLEFIFYLLTKYDLKKLAFGTGQPLIKASELKNLKLFFPKKFGEQQKIGSFFKQLDETIALHQRKLDLLKEQKKGYLQKMFPKNGAKVPELRFAGFADDWEERKLGDLSKISRGASPRPIQDPKWFDNNSDIGWLRIADVTEQNGRITHLEQKISKLAEEKTRVLLTPHLLLSIAATVGKPVINYVKTGVHDGFLIFYNPQFDQEFMFQWLEMFRPKWQKYGQPGSQVNLNSELVKNQDILLPLLEEQVKIGTFFKQLDDTIALHQRKLDLLKEQKKGFLQKMFV
ncbi:restriction endonuclease subunit S [Enterococcus faecalis]|uniref:restriction endonuclease subunit S n=1 Tax=Enterococcus faecalis TaxID=1351 RepID=UPI00201B175D|nr:restriction endonuclease subunit S [Enterococcus faecalis]MCL4596218.1 restriction endonuclease subunit S [Enterococcus faecalis]